MALDSLRYRMTGLPTASPNSLAELATSRPLIMFVQPFGIGATSGGSRIYRALLENAPLPFCSIATASSKPPPPRFGEQIHLPQYQSLGRLERTRLKWMVNYYEFFRLSAFERRIERMFRERNAAAVHVLSHATDCFAVARAARRLHLPVFLTVHDDILYHYSSAALGKRIAPQLSELWNQADHRFVISEAMGYEYCRRYGTQQFTIVTDGAETLSPLYDPQAVTNGTIYFGGMFHIEYEPNVHALLKACGLIAAERAPDAPPIALQFRCASVRSCDVPTGVNFEILPFAHESVVAEDIRRASLLYFPMKFGAGNAAFSRFSLSTKLISYIASGHPILYHGPVESAAADLLRKHDAAIMCYSLEPAEIKKSLETPESIRLRVAANALQLAQQQFVLQTQRKNFWAPILEKLGVAE